MARLARVEVFAADEIAIVHVINRTVRRCFLMGDDPLTGKNYDHRKAWMERELEHLARFFSILDVPSLHWPINTKPSRSLLK